MSAVVLTFDPQTHTSRLSDGREVPHVTAILAETGLSTDFEDVMAISRRARSAVNDQRLLGSVVHQDCHAYDDGDLVWDSLDPRSLPYVTSWAVCRQNLGLEPLSRERQVYHPLHDYTGIFDGIFRYRQDRRVLVDLKIGNPEDAAAHLQTAAYEAAFLTANAGPIHERWAIRLMPDAQMPYRVTNYTGRPNARHDFRIFLAALCVYREQAPRRRAS